MRNNIYKVTLMIILMSISITISGCGINNEKTSEEVENSIITDIQLNKVEKSDSKNLKRFYKLNSNDYEWVILYTPKSTMDVNEILIVKVKDESQIELVEDSIDSRINYQLQSFSGYGPEQCALIENHEIETKGNFIFFAISENVDDIKDSFINSIRK